MQTELTLLQIELVKHLLAQPGATIRWYSHRHANKDVAGRGELRDDRLEVLEDRGHAAPAAERRGARAGVTATGRSGNLAGRLVGRASTGRTSDLSRELHRRTAA